MSSLTASRSISLHQLLSFATDTRIFYLYVLQVEQVREQMELDKRLKQLAAELAEVTKGGKEPDEDLVRSHTLAALEAWVAKAKGQLWSLASEEQMLVQMQAHRRAHPEAASGGGECICLLRAAAVCTSHHG